jgi:hypothetical protein
MQSFSSTAAAGLLELAGHAEQATADAGTSLKVFASQEATLLPAPVYPASAKQSVTAVEPVETPVAELAGQSAHAALPVESLKNPGSHWTQRPPSGPVYPLSHTHVGPPEHCPSTAIGEIKRNNKSAGTLIVRPGRIGAADAHLTRSLGEEAWSGTPGFDRSDLSWFLIGRC